MKEFRQITPIIILKLLQELWNGGVRLDIACVPTENYLRRCPNGATMECILLAQAAGVAALHEQFNKTKAIIPVERRCERRIGGAWLLGLPLPGKYLLFCGNAGLHKALKNTVSQLQLRQLSGLSSGWYHGTAA